MSTITHNKHEKSRHGITVISGHVWSPGGFSYAIELIGRATALHNIWLATKGFSPRNTNKYLATRAGDTPLTHQEMDELLDLPLTTSVSVWDEPITPRVNQQNVYAGTKAVGFVANDWGNEHKATFINGGDTYSRSYPDRQSALNALIEYANK